MNSRENSTVARLVSDEPMAKRIADSVSESFDSSATAAFEGTDGTWSVELHFEHPPDEAEVRLVVGQCAGTEAAARLTFETIAARDWVAASLADLKPVIAGRFTVHGAHDRAQVAPNRIGIEIEAALAFGTGHHGTTRGCLLALDGLLKQRRPRQILDIGTGTGVLAIAAARALRRPALASDIDPEAVVIARENARLNGVAPLVTAIRAQGLTGPGFLARAPFDLVLANILLAPLTRLARPMRRLLAPGARVVLSGLLAHQENAALAAYRPHGLKLVRRIPLGEWVTLVLAKPD
ncbi:MAG: ribosomal protein methyltransferase [Hyphomicrobiales bacterium]|jgi:ribosomal protein L11 methyltransferase|nr:ribosomal protein methyltransferase [Hyphomicrobiales bacterium]